MLDSQLTKEYTKLLFGFYGRAQVLGFPFAGLIFFIFYGKTDLVGSLVWLCVVCALHGLQMIHARRFERAQGVGSIDYQGWSRAALTAFFIQGVAWGSVMLLMTPDTRFEFFLVAFLLTLSVLAFSASGYSRMVMAYAIPVFSAIAIAAYFHVQEYRFLTALVVIGIVLFYMISRVFEKALLESIQIRFEKQELLAALEVKKEEAEQANNAKSVLLASASHDLRQPLHAIGLYLDSLVPILNTKEQSALGEKIALSVEALTTLFDSILDVSKLDSGIIKPVVESINLEEVLGNVKRNFESEASRKELACSWEIKPFLVESDPVLLERIVSNLLSNAVRYTRSGEVRLRCVEQDDRIVLEVSDTGPGITEDEIGKIFNEFYQISSGGQASMQDSAPKGLGLGLSIVRRLCDLLGHELTVSSVPGSGTRFTLSLPRGIAQKTDHDNKIAKSAMQLSALKVLVVDDDANILDAISKVLTRWGCDPRTAGSQSEALQLVDSGFAPQIVICDYRLAEHTTGVEVIEALTHALKRKVPAILVTGDTSPQVLAKIASSGYELLHKPVRPGLLKNAIAYSLSHNENG